MNLLLIGGSNSLMDQMIKKLNKEGHRVSVLTGSRFRMEKYEHVFERYDFTYDAVNLPEVFSSVNPDATIFLGACDSNFAWGNAQSEAVRFISGLMNILAAFSTLRRGRLIYLSSQCVFNGMSPRAYTEKDVGNAADYRGMAVAQGEELCESFRISRELDIVTVRLGGLYYMPRTRGHIDNTVSRMCFEALTERRIRPVSGHTTTLIHEADAVQFLTQLTVAPSHKLSRYQLSSGVEITEEELAEKVLASFRRAEAAHSGRGEERKKQDIRVQKAKADVPSTEALSNTAFREEFGMNRLRDLDVSIDEIADYMLLHERVFAQDREEELPWYKRWMKSLGGAARAIVPFVENLICFIPFFMLNNRAVGSEYFSGVDLFLFYVLLFAVVHGQQQATVSAILATAGYLFRQMYTRTGYDVIVDYNTYIWIAQIFVIGLVVGYMKDQLSLQKSEARADYSYMAGQIDDIKEINSSNVRIKDIMQMQIINQTDSIGKIYEITSTLDQYSYEEVLFYAAEILENIMDTGNVSIYTVDNGSYARLFTASSHKAASLGNSVRYTELTDLYACISQRHVFINKQLDPGLPSMASAIYDGNDMSLIIMVWELPWEKMTLGQSDLLVVTGALIQNAALRANRYLAALQSERFLHGTPILNSAEFISLVDAYVKARERGLTVFSLIELDILVEHEAEEIPAEADAETAVESETEEVFAEGTDFAGLVRKAAEAVRKFFEPAPAYVPAPQEEPEPEPAAASGDFSEKAQKLSRQIRPHDYLGEGRAGRLYVLLTNTDAESAVIVMERLGRLDVGCRLVDRIT